MIDKARLITALLQELEAELQRQTQAALLARDEATNEESRADNKYDTRAQEAAYLAEGQARQATELTESIAVYRDMTLPAIDPGDKIVLGCAVTIDGAGRKLHVLVGPRAGGTDFNVGDTTYTVVTPASPLGRELLGRREGDLINLIVKRRPQPHRIVEVA